MMSANFKFQISDFRFQILDSGFWILDLRFRLRDLDLGCQPIIVAEHRMDNKEYESQNPRHEVPVDYRLLARFRSRFW